MNSKKIDLCDGCFTIKEIAFVTEFGQAFCKECMEREKKMKLYYLTKKGKKLLEKQIENANKKLDDISKKPIGTYAWRMQKRYIDGLEYILDMECNSCMKEKLK